MWHSHVRHVRTDLELGRQHGQPATVQSELGAPLQNSVLIDRCVHWVSHASDVGRTGIHGKVCRVERVTGRVVGVAHVSDGRVLVKVDVIGGTVHAIVCGRVCRRSDPGIVGSIARRQCQT